MRFHKASKITAEAAKELIGTPTSSLNENVVISHNSDWYDVRAMTQRELDDFVNDLLGSERAALESGLITPH